MFENTNSHHKGGTGLAITSFSIASTSSYSAPLLMLDVDGMACMASMAGAAGATGAAGAASAAGPGGSARAAGTAGTAGAAGAAGAAFSGMVPTTRGTALAAAKRLRRSAVQWTSCNLLFTAPPTAKLVKIFSRSCLDTANKIVD